MAPSNKHIVWFVLGCGVLVLAAPIDKTAQAADPATPTVAVVDETKTDVSTVAPTTPDETKTDVSTAAPTTPAVSPTTPAVSPPTPAVAVTDATTADAPGAEGGAGWGQLIPTKERWPTAAVVDTTVGNAAVAVSPVSPVSPVAEASTPSLALGEIILNSKHPPLPVKGVSAYVGELMVRGDGHVSGETVSGVESQPAKIKHIMDEFTRDTQYQANMWLSQDWVKHGHHVDRDACAQAAKDNNHNYFSYNERVEAKETTNCISAPTFVTESKEDWDTCPSSLDADGCKNWRLENLNRTPELVVQNVIG